MKRQHSIVKAEGDNDVSYDHDCYCPTAAQPLQVTVHRPASGASLLPNDERNNKNKLFCQGRERVPSAIIDRISTSVSTSCASICTVIDAPLYSSSNENELDWKGNGRPNSIRKRRLCQVDGCFSVVKSQRLCQRHGAKARPCKVDGCNKQAQGSFDGMCKMHYKAQAYSPAPEYQLVSSQCFLVEDQKPSSELTSSEVLKVNDKKPVESVYESIIPSTISWTYRSSKCMPLASYLEQGYSEQMPLGWHRNLERVAQHFSPCYDLSMPLERWEVDLAWTEIALLTGFPDNAFVHLAHAWGREPGFHYGLARSVCEERSTVAHVASDNNVNSRRVDQTSDNSVPTFRHNGTRIGSKKFMDATEASLEESFHAFEDENFGE